MRAGSAQVETVDGRPIIAASLEWAFVQYLLAVQFTHLDVPPDHVREMALDIDGGDTEFVDDVRRGEVGHVVRQVRHAAIGILLPDPVPAGPAAFLLAKVARGNLPEIGRALARRRL